jgi:hypothetical protein
LPKGKDKDLIKIKRENWNHKYRVVARRNGKLVTNRAWHTAHDRQMIVDRVFTFQEGSRYSYRIGSYDRNGNPRSLTITSSRKIDLGESDSPQRRKLFDEIKNKYARKDEKYEELHGFFLLARTDLDTREKKRYYNKDLWPGEPLD